jgi:mitochondrial fission protein ELM1
LKVVQERTGNTLEAIGIGNDFLSRPPVTQQLKERINKLDFMELKTLFKTKEIAPKLKRLPTEWQKIIASYTTDKGLITRIYRELKKNKTPQNSIIQ